MTVVYRQQMSYCGKARCQRCQCGIGHGPYWYAYQNVQGHTKRIYVGKHLPPDVQATPQEPLLSAPVAPPPPPPAREPDELVLIRLYTLGQFRLERRREEGDWETVTEAAWYQQGVSSLLGCLLRQERTLHREQVMDALWPTAQQEQALLNNRLDRLVYTVRQLFEPTRLPHTPSSLFLVDHERLSLSRTQLWTDVDTFETTLSEAMTCDDPGLQERLLVQAAHLYGGDFLPDERRLVSVRTRRDALRRGWVGLLLALSDLRSQRENLHEALDPLERILTSDPANEAAVQRQLKLLGQLGRRSEGLRAYKRLAAYMEETYHIAPLPDTRALYEALRQGKPVVSPATSTDASLALQRAPHQVPAQVGRHHTTPLVGREHELHCANTLLDDIQRTLRLKLARQPRVMQQAQPQNAHGLLLLGDIGIGKTRMAEESVLHATRTGWQVVWSRAYRQEHLISYHVWVDLLRQAIHVCVWKRSELSSKSLLYQPLGVLLPELAPLLHEVPPPARVPDQEEIVLWDAILSWLMVLSQDAPLLLVIDDMHWMDARSVQLWSYLLRRIQGAPIALMGTCRQHEAQALLPLLAEMDREHNGTVLLLRPLAEPCISQLLAPLALSPDTRSQIVTRAAGNPFFAEELARQAAVPTAPADDEPSGRRRPTVPTLPETIDAALEMRLRRLSLPCQRLLAKAAVLGHAFALSVICAMERQTSSATEDQVLEVLEEAIVAGILIETEMVPTHIRYQFWHPLFVSHLCDHGSAARRASAHRQAARALEEVAMAVGVLEVEAQAAAIVAHLHAGAGEASRLAHYAALAGDRAATMLDCAEAERLYRLALQTHAHLPTSGPQVQLLWERLADVERILCQGQEAKVAYEQALALHLAFPDPGSSPQMHASVHAMYLVEIAHSLYNNAQLQQAQDTLAQARVCLLTAQVQQGSVWGALEFIGAYVFWKQGTYEQAMLGAHKALAYFETALAEPHTVPLVAAPSHLRRTLAGDPVDIGRVHRFLGALLSSSVSSSVQEALQHQQQARAIFEQYGCVREAGSILCDIGNVYLQQAEHASADAYFQQCLQATERIGDTGIQCVAWCNRGIVAQREGRSDEARNVFGTRVGPGPGGAGPGL